MTTHAGAPILVVVLSASAIFARHSLEVVNDQALLKQLGYSSQDLQRIGAGEILGRSIEADSSTVALAVAGTMAVPAGFYLEKFQAIESFKRTSEVLQIGRFGRVPSAGDAASLTLDDDDVNDLKDCRVNDCGVKLDAEGITRLAARDAAPGHASDAMRQYLAAYVQRYLQGGNKALIEYRDASPPRRLADALRAILDRSSYLPRGWPLLSTAVADFSGSLPDRLDHFVYWSKEKAGPRPLVTVTHAIMSPLQDGTAGIATKQIYASHYINGSLGLTLLFDRGSADAPRTMVIYVNRSRLDIFGGLLGGIKRPLVRSRARDGAERMMRQLRERLEREYVGSR